jgi:hypothetical protein
MSHLNTRVDKLEAAAGIGTGRIIVVVAAADTPDEDVDAEIADVKPNDLIVRITRFADGDTVPRVLSKMALK